MYVISGYVVTVSVVVGDLHTYVQSLRGLLAWLGYAHR